MSWRRFMVLVRCLSQQSATIQKLQSKEFIGGKRNDVIEVTSPKAAEQAFQAAFRK